MLKIKNMTDFEQSLLKEKLPTILIGSIHSDVILMTEQLDSEYYNEKQVDLYGPLVLVMTDEEFFNIEKIVPSIEKKNYEYKEIVAVSHEHFVNKLCYLFNNGESGIIVYTEYELVHILLFLYEEWCWPVFCVENREQKEKDGAFD